MVESSYLITDAESHILFFDIEGLIFELHSEEYAAMSPTTLEVSIEYKMYLSEFLVDKAIRKM